jgi:eukaryotic-like serine/threonine-protein kinase
MKNCPSCGAALMDDLLEGHCPACLLQVTFNEGSASVASSAPPLAVVFANYELLEEVARGGMGVIYRARQASLNRIVALKMLVSAPFASREAIERFRTEARAAAALQHPNIVSVHEVGECEGQPFYTMDFVEGRSLADLVRIGPLPVQVAARYVEQVAHAIHFAHEHGVLHRDLKPSNVLIDPLDQPRVTDFGIAKQLGENSALTLTGRVLGSPSYMPPEQVSSERGEISARSDVYSLGALLYQLITARAPFAASAVAETLQQVLNSEPLSPRALNPSVPLDLETICLKCLEKDSAQRYATARDLADELARFRSGEPIRARPVSALEKGWRWCRRNPVLAAMTVLATVLLIALALGSWIATWRIELARRAEFRQGSRATQANVELANANTRLKESVATLELQRAEQSFRSGDASMGLAQLAAVLRRDPSNHIAAERITSALLHCNWILPMGGALRHPSFVGSVSFSSSGQYLVSGCADGFARVWSVQTRQQIGDGLKHPAYVRGVCFSPDETRIATACEDGNVRIWNRRTMKATICPVAPRDWLFSVSFSPDGERLVAGCGDRAAHIFSARSGELQLVLRGHTGAVRQAVFSPDGRLIATASEDGSARLWKADSGEPFGAVLRHPFVDGVLNGVTFSPDGQRLATSSRGRTAVIWNVDTGILALPVLHHPDGLNDIQFSPNGRIIVTTGFDGTVRLWDAQSGELISQPFRHSEQVNAAAFSPDGRVLATASDDRTVNFWEVRPGQMLEQRMRHESTVNAVEFSGDGRWLATASYDGSARVWDVETERSIAGPLQHTGNVQGMCFSPDNRFVATASGDSTAWVWDVKTAGRAKGPFVHGLGLWAVSFSPDGRRLLAASADGTAKLWDIDSQQVAISLQHSGQVLMARFSPDGTHVATASRDHTARIWDAASGAPVTPNLAHLDEVLDIQFSPDGLRVATASKDNTARIWNARTGQPIGSVLRHLRTVNTIAFSHDGLRVITASADRTARIWNAATGEPLTPSLEHGDTVLDASFSPDDQRVLTASMDRTARVWDAATGLPLSEPLRHNGPVKTARFSPDGEKVATGAFAVEYPARIWQVPSVRAPAPDWLPSFAEAVAGPPVETEGSAGLPSKNNFDALRKQFDSLGADEAFSHIARWFLADRASRAISPFQSQTIAERVQRRIEENTRASLEEAIRLDPVNPAALGHLANVILKADSSPSGKADAAHLAQLALRFDPQQAEAREVVMQIQSGNSVNREK